MRHIKLFENFGGNIWDDIKEIIQPYLHELEDEMDYVNVSDEILTSYNNEWISPLYSINKIHKQHEGIGVINGNILIKSTNKNFLITRGIITRMESDLINSGYTILSNLNNEVKWHKIEYSQYGTNLSNSSTLYRCWIKELKN